MNTSEFWTTLATPRAVSSSSICLQHYRFAIHLQGIGLVGVSGSLSVYQLITIVWGSAVHEQHKVILLLCSLLSCQGGLGTPGPLEVSRRALLSPARPHFPSPASLSGRAPSIHLLAPHSATQILTNFGPLLLCFRKSL